MTVSYSTYWWKHDGQVAQGPGLLAVARRWRPIIEEWSGPGLEEVDLGAGRALVIPAQAPIVRGTFCALCWGRGSIMETGPLGLAPVLCDCCAGRGWV